MTPNYFRRFRWLFAATLVLALANATEMYAQRFQFAYGGPACTEAGRAGVTQLRNGGYVTVGETYSTGNPCGPSHIYVVYTAANGTLVWSNYYTIGQSDSALDVVECCNGDLAICGVTTNPLGCNFGRDAFLLRLTNAGAVVAVNTFGTPNSDEIAWNLVEARSGDGVLTNPGDFIVAGSTTWQAGIVGGVAQRDGYIFRTNQNLVLIWDQHYGGPASRDDYLYGVYEVRFGVPAAGTAGDIVATGGTNTWGAGLHDIWVLRVDGNNGTMGLPPHNAATYGGPRFDEGRAIIELRFATNPGDLVITGISHSRPMNVNSEVAMLQTGADPCTFVADHYAGDNDPHADGGLDLKEDAFPPVSCNGDVIVTGYTDWGGVINPLNVFLQRFTCGTMAPLGAGMAYGGSADDWGWSVDNCRREGFCNDETEGYIVAGFTKSPDLIGADPQQLYLIKTDINLNSGCNQTMFNFIAQAANFIRLCPRPPIMPIGQWCGPNINQTPVQWQTQLCYFYPVARGGGDGGDNVGSVTRPATITLSDGSVSSYPNPVSAGVAVNLRLSEARTGEADVTITDAAGARVFNQRIPMEAGKGTQGISTAGWAAGTYYVRVVVNGHTSVTKFVLVD